MNRQFFSAITFCLSAFLISCSVPRTAGQYKVVKYKNQKTKTEQTETAQQNVRQEKFRLDFDDDASRISVFNVVIGSFSNRQNAINLKNAQMPDYNPIIVVNEKGMFRVILISYKTYEQAKEKISEIVDRFPDAWVLIQEK